MNLELFRNNLKAKARKKSERLSLESSKKKMNKSSKGRSLD